MTDMFRKATTGDGVNGIPADLYNLLQEVAKDYLSRRGAARATPIKLDPKVELYIKNDTGDTLAQFAIVRNGGAKLIFPADADTSFFGKAIFKSLAPFATQPFAILQLPATADAIVPAIASGMSLCRLALTNPLHGFADCVSGVYTHLQSQSGPGPVEILWTGEDVPIEVEGSTSSDSGSTIPADDIVWALVRFSGSIAAGSSSYHLGKSITVITAATGTTPGMGFANYWTVDNAGDFTNTGITRAVLNTCAAIPIGEWVDIELEPFSNREFVMPRCVAGSDSGSSGSSGSGGGFTCGFCPTIPAKVCFPAGFGVTKHGVPSADHCVYPCAATVDLWPNGPIELSLTTDCTYLLTTACGTPSGFLFHTLSVVGANWVLAITITAGGGTGAVATYSAPTSGWACDGPLVLTKVYEQPRPSECWLEWPNTITAYPCGGTCNVTVDFDDSDLAITATTISGTGTGLDASVPGNNLFTFNLGADGVCTASTATTWTVTFSTPPTTAGVLTAFVEVGACTSETPVQVAHVTAGSSGESGSGDGTTCAEAKIAFADTTYALLHDEWWTYTATSISHVAVTIAGDGDVSTWLGSCDSLESAGIITAPGCHTYALSTGNVLFIRGNSGLTSATLTIATGDCP